MIRTSPHLQDDTAKRIDVTGFRIHVLSSVGFTAGCRWALLRTTLLDLEKLLRKPAVICDLTFSRPAVVIFETVFSIVVVVFARDPEVAQHRTQIAAVILLNENILLQSC